MSLFLKHQELLNKALEATYNRTFFAAYPENAKSYSETGIQDASNWFNGIQNSNFSELLQNGTSWQGEESSPYLNKSLGIKYPTSDVDTYISNAQESYSKWKKVNIEERTGLLIECLENIKSRFFDIAQATMQTTGQAWMMSFQASGPHANDRALESIALGYDLISKFQNNSQWIKPMGKFEISVEKKFKQLGKGIGLVIGCSTFPVWNSIPGIFANLIAGNSVIVKPHPNGILSIAVVVAEIQKTFKEKGFEPLTIQLAVDTLQNPITKILAENPLVKLIDYTGNSTFGNYIESIPNKTSFTEKAGVNCIVIDSSDNLQAMCDNIAFSSTLYSGQMCTAPQNIFISQDGINSANGNVPYQDVVEQIKKSIENIVNHPKMGPAILGAIQNPTTKDRVTNLSSKFENSVLNSNSINNEEFPQSRTATPLILEIDVKDINTYSEELFGPILLIIKTENTHQSIEIASDLAKKHGAISSAAYTTNSDVQELMMNKMEEAFTPVAFNLTGQTFMNQNAAFSDFHVTGGNLAGNASFTDQAYIAKRFVWVGHKIGK